MSPELIAILAMGVGLAGLVVTSLAKLEGLLAGLPEAVTGRRVSGDAA